VTHDADLDAATRDVVIERVLTQLHAHYVFPEAATRMEEAVRKHVRDGVYNAVPTEAALCTLLMAQLQEVSRDKHLRLIYSAEALPERDNAYEDPAWLEEERQAGLLANFGLHCVERLPGNVGLLEHRGYFYDPAYAGDTLVAAMRLLAHTDALIIDLRHNRGGESAMVALLCSLVLPATPIHLGDFYTRDTDTTEQSWTLPYLPISRYDTNPLFVLTSARTFSAGEEVAYNLQSLKRATIVGETTRGGAHPREQYRITAHSELALPNARAINALTGTNWEGVGVTPDIAVPREAALRTAHRAALTEALARREGSLMQTSKDLVEEARTALGDREEVSGR